MRKSYSRDFENGPVAFGWVAMTWPPCWVAMLQIRWGAAMQNLVPNARFFAHTLPVPVHIVSLAAMPPPPTSEHNVHEGGRPAKRHCRL